MYHKRHIEEKVKLFAKHFKVVLILGARQVGKSTLLKQIFPELQCIVFDSTTDKYLARTDPEMFLQNFPSPIILDEVQYVPELLAVIKRYVDNNESRGQYFLTGSHNFAMLKQISESMAGRVGIIELMPLSLYEIVNEVSVKYNWLQNYLTNNSVFSNLPHPTFHNYVNSLYETIWRGNMPGILDFPNQLIPEYFKSYFQTYLERDVRVVGQIEDLNLFSNFISILAVLSSQEINYNELGREIGVQPKTISRWMNIARACYQWHEVMPYHGNAIKRISKKNKGYFFDTGLLCYLQQISSSAALATNINRGAVFETWVVNQIKILCDTLNMAPKMYHWRTIAGAEVDLLLELDNIFYPIEIKCKVQLSGHDTRGLTAFYETYSGLNIAKGLIIYAGNESFPINERTLVLSWKALC